MELKALIAECTAYDFKVMLEEKKPKSRLKSVSAFANGLGGSLFFGIDNDGVVKGLDDVQHVCEEVMNLQGKELFSYIRVSQLEKIPIPKLNAEADEVLKNLASDIKNRPNPLILSKIDLLVYHLYGLTYDEVLIVDPETPITREEYELYRD